MTLSDNLRADLDRRVRGRVISPGDRDFDGARTPWNLAVDQPVRAVVDAVDPADVAAVVRYARSSGFTVAAQASGHGATGDVEGVILLRTAGLDDLRVLPVERTASAGAGVKWGEVLASAGAHGMLGLAGSSPVVSVVGYTLGGGLSWFSRRHGFASSSVRSFDIVDAEGTGAKVTADSDPDLFWALRGGSGDFALVTAIEFDLHPAPELYGGRMLWPVERAPEAFDAFQAVTAAAPDQLTVWFDLLQFPESPPFVAVDATYLGPADEGRDLLGPFDRIDGVLSDSRGHLPVAELGSITAEPTDPSPGVSRGELLAGLEATVVDALLSDPIDPLLSVQVRHLGGALTCPSQSAAGHIDEPYALYMFGTPDAAGPEKIAARQDQIVAALGPTVSGRKPYTHLRPSETAAAAFPAGTLRRLQQIKRERDPHGVLRSNYPVL